MCSGFPSARDKRKHQSWSNSDSGDGKEIQEARKRDGRGTPQGGSFKIFFWRRGRAELAKPLSSSTTCWLKFTVRTFSIVTRNRRRRTAEISRRLETIHPNPGPGRDNTEAGVRARMERKYERRREKRKQREEAERKKKKFLNIITWNVQGMSMGTHNRRKLREVAKYVKQNNWDAALLTEIRSTTSGTVWLGEGDDLIAVRHTKRAAVLLRGQLLKSWCEEGQRSKEHDRIITVKAQGLTLTSVYLPVYHGGNDIEIEEEKQKLKEHIDDARSEYIVIVGGDFNAHVGADEDRPGTCGKYGQGSELLEWCEENSMCHVNSFYQNQRRGTWFKVPLRKWYEIDGFLMKNDQRHRYVRKVNTIDEKTISDHRPKRLKLEMKEKKIVRRQRPKKRPRVLLEKLRDEIQQLVTEKKSMNFSKRVQRSNSTKMVTLLSGIKSLRLLQKQLKMYVDLRRRKLRTHGWWAETSK